MIQAMPPAPPAIVGRASVIDADTLEIRGQRVRLWGVDAPESAQTCERGGTQYRCGQVAANALSVWIGDRPVSCAERDRDRYARIVATCTVGGEDLGGWLIQQGWAVEYTQYSDGRYAAPERAARNARAGMHAGRFAEPSAWRAEGRAPAAPVPPPPGECSIKGNISRDGERIYHLPSAASYAATRINTEAGERWFCSEAEARAAGWRLPR